LLKTYFKAFPDGQYRKDNWEDIAYFYVEPTWIRYSDFNSITPQIEEFKYESTPKSMSRQLFVNNMF